MGRIGPMGRTGTHRAFVLRLYKRTQSAVAKLSRRGIGFVWHVRLRRWPAPAVASLIRPLEFGFVSQGSPHLTVSRIGFVSCASLPLSRKEGYLGPISESLGPRRLNSGITRADGVLRSLRTASTDRRSYPDSRRLMLVFVTQNPNFSQKCAVPGDTGGQQPWGA